MMWPTLSTRPIDQRLPSNIQRTSSLVAENTLKIYKCNTYESVISILSYKAWPNQKWPFCQKSTLKDHKLCTSLFPMQKSNRSDYLHLPGSFQAQDWLNIIFSIPFGCAIQRKKYCIHLNSHTWSNIIHISVDIITTDGDTVEPVRIEPASGTLLISPLKIYIGIPWSLDLYQWYFTTTTIRVFFTHQVWLLGRIWCLQEICVSTADHEL